MGIQGILQVFGKTLVSRDLEIGSQYARKYDVDAVTLDGVFFPSNCERHHQTVFQRTLAECGQ